MNRKAVALGAAVVAAGGVWWTLGRGKARAAEEVPATVRGGVELTVYSEDFGMVRETRPVSLAAGDNKIPVVEVSQKLDPHSVLFDWKGESEPAVQTGDGVKEPLNRRATISINF